MALIRKQTIPIEQPPLVGEVSVNFGGHRVPRGERNGSQRPLILNIFKNVIHKSVTYI
jgi:hypothetical protein